VQVKNKHERSLPVRPPGVEKTSRLGSRDPVASGVKCGPYGDKNGKMKSWTVSWLSLKTKVEKNFYRLPFTPPPSSSPNRSFNKVMLKFQMHMSSNMF
jgi:hypothetical protein